ncbi:YybH family protein [Sphingomonas sp. Y38-1Y]|uniref:YybH family protein n=1 Tax=Sphingomonas sp. Y38-1Y TaxID=3078265 RepID=UPI0028E39D47|nr:nuclear transport factor 2 family protein [Sphingomonas sp. Y38-1Y]
MSPAETAIRTARLHWNAAIATGDVEGAVGPVTRDCVLVPAGGEPFNGRAAIALAWRRLLGQGGRYVREVERIEAGEGVAAEFGRWRSDAGLSGAYLAEWHEGAEGWRCARELYVQLSG